MPLRRRLPLCDESGPAMVMGSLSFAAATGTPPAITSKKADTEDECSGRCFYMRPQMPRSFASGPSAVAVGQRGRVIAPQHDLRTGATAMAVVDRAGRRCLFVKS